MTTYQVNGVDLITDRTNDDVAELKTLIQKGLANMTPAEKTKYLAGLKGAYNATDVTRVQNAVIYLHGELSALPENLRNYAFELGADWQDEFDVPYTYPIADLGEWSETLYQTGSHMSGTERGEMLRDVRALGKLLNTVSANMPTAMERMTVFAANAIEQTLGELDVAYIALKAEKEAMIRDAVNRVIFMDADGYIFTDSNNNIFRVLRED